MKKRDNESLRHEKLHIFYYGSILNWALDPWGNERELFSVRLEQTSLYNVQNTAVSFSSKKKRDSETPNNQEVADVPYSVSYLRQ